MTNPKIFSVLLCAALLCAVLVCLAGNAQAAYEYEYMYNGDFEITDGWGGLRELDATPAGWYDWVPGGPPQYVSGEVSITGNTAIQQSGLDAIGGSGTSALIPSTTEAGLSQLLQPAMPGAWGPFIDTGPLWEFSMDIASADPLGTRSLSMYLFPSLNQDSSGTMVFRIINGTEPGFGTLQYFQRPYAWVTSPELTNCIVFDSNVTTSPVTNHIRITGDFSEAISIYNIYVTDANSVEHQITGLRGDPADPNNAAFNWGALPAAGDGIALVRIVQYNDLAPYSESFLIDNVSLTGATPPVYVPGDANADGKVDAVDAAIMADNWLTASANCIWATGDFNGDRMVNDLDAALMAANWGYGVVASASVPEPSTIALLSIMFVSLLVWRRRA